ncbi:MAG: SRPBCC domain-containing protein [Bacteroidia bacterium]|nr:SRPBCC domain-containing protein [Bacteroidia bacterium]HQU99961.1 SRPBCC domain-containing protein [Bacteroidia bacterium]
MNKPLFDFVADKANNTLVIKREFDAPRQMVWDCYTKQEYLDQWFAPKPFTTKTKSMDFSNGGHWHYAMIDPDGNHYWGYTTYNNIKPIDTYQTEDAFSNEAGEINTELPQAKWEVTFKDFNALTIVETIVYYNSLQDLETIINMGMQEGMKATLEKLDELLLSLKNETR